jgi:SsrA-binding protein
MKTFNKKANFNYKLENDRIEAGLVLSGGEAKAVRTGHADLTSSYAKVLDGELYLVNAKIPILGAKDYDPGRSRKLLLHKSELLSLVTRASQQKLLLVPISLYTKGHFIKTELALGKAKHKFEKKNSIKAKDIQRDIELALKG